VSGKGGLHGFLYYCFNIRPMGDLVGAREHLVGASNDWLVL